MYILKITLAGAAAGIINGLLGAGGGMVLVPLLTLFALFEERELFPASITIMLPICLVSLFVLSRHAPLPWMDALPYMLGSAVGGLIAAVLSRHIPTIWLHRSLGLLILWGGIRYLCG